MTAIASAPVHQDLPRLVPRLNRFIRNRPTPRQAAFLLVGALEAFYGGAAGGAKSVGLLMAALQYVDVPGYAALLVRENFGMLTQPGGLIAIAQEWLAGTDASWNATDHRWRFPSGATLTFRHMSDSGAERNFQGAQYHFIGVDEVTDLSETQYRFLFSRLRRGASDRLPVRMRAASNPYGPGLEWCYQRFILGQGPNRVFIPARLEDNPYLDHEQYERALLELGSVEYRQLRYGDWTIRPEGGLFRREWFDRRFVDRQDLPERMRLCRFWDLAATEEGRGRDPDHTAGVLLGRTKDGQVYVIDVRRARSSPLATEKMVRARALSDRDFARETKGSLVVRMEQEPGSSGVTVIDHYRRNVLQEFDFRGERSTGSKETRVGPVVARAEAGDVWICRGAWNTEFLDELIAFPLAGHDDQVDALSGAYAHVARARPTLTGLPVGMWEPSYFLDA